MRANGDKYEGDWKTSVKHGFGKEYYSASGDLYEGEFN